MRKANKAVVEQKALKYSDCFTLYVCWFSLDALGNETQVGGYYPLMMFTQEAADHGALTDVVTRLLGYMPSDLFSSEGCLSNNTMNMLAKFIVKQGVFYWVG